MKSIANQYKDLKEGKMTQSNFMRNLRMTMPQYITNVTSFNDAVKILKNKRILSESSINELSPQARNYAAMAAIKKNYNSDDTIDRMTAGSQYNTFTELPKSLQDKGREIAELIKNEIGASEVKHELKKIIHTPDSNVSSYIIYNVSALVEGRTIKEFKVVIEKDKRQLSQYNVLLSDKLNRVINRFIELLQKELDVEFKSDSLNENRAFEVAKRLKAEGMDEDSIYVYLVDDMGLSGMAAQSVIDDLFNGTNESPSLGEYYDGPSEPMGDEAFGDYYEMVGEQLEEIARKKYNLDEAELEQMFESEWHSGVNDKDIEKAFDEGIEPSVMAERIIEKYINMDDDMFDDMIKRSEDELGPDKYKFDDFEGGLSEGKKKAEPKAKLHPNQIHPGELRMGIRVEMEHTDDPKKAEKIALDHLAENPYYYTALKLAGVDSPSAPKAKVPVEKKARKKKEAVELVDKANAMQKVKMPKIVKENLNEGGGEFMFSGTLTDSEAAELRKIAPGIEIEQEELDDTYKTVVSHPMYNEKTLRHAIDQVTGKLPQKKQFGHTVGFGNVLQSKLEALVREVLDEMYDGRDNLDAEN